MNQLHVSPEEAYRIAREGDEARDEVARLREALESIRHRGRALMLTADQAYTIANHALASDGSHTTREEQA